MALAHKHEHRGAGWLALSAGGSIARQLATLPGSAAQRSLALICLISSSAIQPFSNLRRNAWREVAANPFRREIGWLTRLGNLAWPQ